MKKLVTVILCSLFIMASVQSAFTAAAGAEGAAGSPAAERTVTGTVNINDAGVDVLMSLPGIGEKTAEKISAYREANGPFKRVDDLLNVKGIGPKVLEKIRPLLSLS